MRVFAALLIALSVALTEPVRAAELPLLRVDQASGLIQTEAGDEVRLFGVNYLGGMYQYYAIYRTYEAPRERAPLERPLFRDLGVEDGDVRTAVIDRDLDDMQRMGVDVVRIHVLMGDIAVTDGALREGSVELDWFDYLVAGVIARGMYVYLTPIVGWDPYVTVPGRLSEPDWRAAHFTTSPTAISRSVRFVRAILAHRNPYLNDGAGGALAQQTGLGLVELINEPSYVTDASGANSAAPYSHDYLRNVVIRPLIHAVRLAEQDVGGPEHLVGWSEYNWNRTEGGQSANCDRNCGPANPNVASAIRDSEVQFLAASGYTDQWWQGYPFARDPRRESFLPVASVGAHVDGALEPPGERRGRVVYEFDAPGAQKTYLYPNMAAAMLAHRNQVAAVFQYDMFVDGQANSVWPTHYLNWFYTPARTVSFMVARETFHKRERGAAYVDREEAMLGPHTITSFEHNLSIYADDATFMHSGSVPDDLDIEIGAALVRVVGVGSSEIVRYHGTGLYVLQRHDDGRIELQVNPDVDERERVYRIEGRRTSSVLPYDPSCYCWADPTELTPTRVLVSRRHEFALNWPGVHAFRVSRVEQDASVVEVGTVRAGEPFIVQAGHVNGRDAYATRYVITPMP